MMYSKVSAMSRHQIIFSFCAYICLISCSTCVSQSVKEFEAYKNLSQLIRPHILETSQVQNFIKDPIYLQRWLQAYNLNVKLTLRKLQDHLNWRELAGIDKVDESNWSDVQEEYPVYLDTVDKEGNPIAEIWNKEWPTCPSSDTRGFRWAMKIMEMQTRRLFKARADGSNCTKVVFLTDADVFPIGRGLKCQLFYSGVIKGLQLHYPNTIGILYTRQLPLALEVSKTTVNPFLIIRRSKSTQKFRTDQDWLDEMDTKIEKKERSFRFGGSKRRNNT